MGGADFNSNIVINNAPGISINIYQDDLNFDEIKNRSGNLPFIDFAQCG